ncbi:MAG: thioredoxin domain-containing protein [Deltaproteobacteria bacterium]|nr:thioredoxin domain-containing protein [Deltaproteobacteria bacterium]MBN2670477.1 thioredoxin domain-containing protein [Deltaproteobacteria bacterium]
MAGHSGARTEIIVFSDFQCPFCKKAARELQRLLRAHPNRLKVYFKHFPLDYHPYSQMAAQAAEAARLQGKFWEMHDLLYGHAEELTDDIFSELAEEIGLNIEQFNTDLTSEKVIAKVLLDKADGEKLGVNGTPYFFINRRPFHGSYVDLKSQI